MLICLYCTHHREFWSFALGSRNSITERLGLHCSGGEGVGGDVGGERGERGVGWGRCGGERGWGGGDVGERGVGWGRWGVPR